MSLTGATGARTPCSAPLSLPSPTSSTPPPQFGICLSFPNQFHCLHQFLFVCLCFSRILTAIIWRRSQLSLILILVNTLISLDSSNFDQVGRSYCYLVPICWTQVGARVNIKVLLFHIKYILLHCCRYSVWYHCLAWTLPMLQV